MHFKLVGRDVVEVPDLLTWARWYETADRHVGDDYLHSERYGLVRVSTVFLGLDHGFGFDGAPVLFETMVFREKGTDSSGLPPPDDLVALGFWGEMRRYRTYDEAEAGHAELLAAVSGRGWTPAPRPPIVPELKPEPTDS